MNAETTSADRVSLETARNAVVELMPKLTALLRSIPDASAPAVGVWTVGDVAAHLAHVVGLDLEAARGPGAERRRSRKSASQRRRRSGR